MVQRYSMYVSAQAFGRCHMDEKADGKYVTYEDYAALELKVLAALSHLERASEAAPHMTAGYVKMALRTLKNDN